MINVIVNGAMGKMGKEAVIAIEADKELNLIAAIDKGDSLKDSLSKNKIDAVVDFTHPSCVKENALQILEAGVYPIVGTTGLTDEDLSEIDVLARKKKIGALVIPNFAIGAVLMMKFAAEAAKYMPRAEIIEMHHDKKADAPSGTAIKTAIMMHESNPYINKTKLVETEVIKGARGGEAHQIPIHSLRLPGYIASQKVIFGGQGQTLTLSHDTFSRESFMPGVILAIKRVQSVQGLTYGLENIL